MNTALQAWSVKDAATLCGHLKTMMRDELPPDDWEDEPDWEDDCWREMIVPPATGPVQYEQTLRAEDFGMDDAERRVAMRQAVANMTDKQRQLFNIRSNKFLHDVTGRMGTYDMRTKDLQRAKDGKSYL